MRQGLTPGAEAQVTVTVTDDMLARFEELGLVHPVYSTWTMVRHMELASRKVILPYLEPDEDAVGYSVSVTHTAPTPVGATVTARARLVQVEGNKVTCTVVADNGTATIGEGTTVQIVVAAQALRDRFSRIGATRPTRERSGA
ncbi:MAG: thioesterase family protein [bacterium]